MNLEELKLILDAVKGVSNSAALIAGIYFVLHFLVPVIKYSIVGIVILKALKILTNLFVVEVNKSKE